jgi:hypothetical protein
MPIFIELPGRWLHLVTGQSTERTHLFEREHSRMKRKACLSVRKEPVFRPIVGFARFKRPDVLSEILRNGSKIYPSPQRYRQDGQRPFQQCRQRRLPKLGHPQLVDLRRIGFSDGRGRQSVAHHSGNRLPDCRSHSSTRVARRIGYKPLCEERTTRNTSFVRQVHT